MDRTIFQMFFFGACVVSLCIPYEFIFNPSLETSFPDLLKLSYIILFQYIRVVKMMMDVENYRPISNSIAKVFECLIYKQIIEFIKSALFLTVISLGSSLVGLPIWNLYVFSRLYIANAFQGKCKCHLS